MTQHLIHTMSTAHATTLNALRSIIRHPRSLARPHASWRPPTTALPPVAGSERLTVSVTRRRVGPRARARIRGYGETHTPAYIIELRLTDASGLRADPHITEAWVRALVPADHIAAVHEIPGPRATSYVWLTDAAYTPVRSPSSMFEGLQAA
ncbi:hypothetical protein [Corynebacterium timonense]|nr:hypothetical protein [Corynebacterium timonense]